LTVPSNVAVLQRLRDARGFLFDLDGTLVLGDRNNRGLVPLPGALEMTRWLSARGTPFAIFTNGTTKTPRQYARALAAIGFDVPDHTMLTPVSSAVAVFARRGYRRVLVLGGDALADPLRAAGLEPVLAADLPDGTVPAGVDAVLAGWYPDFTMSALESACHAVWAGAAVYSASESMFFATAQGRALGTSRAICAMIKSLTGCRVEVVGKPALAALRVAASALRVRPSDLAVVGDAPDLEVAMAHRGRALAIAVTSGLADAASLGSLPAGQRPHLSVPGVSELLSLCQHPPTAPEAGWH
jgi:4-nitrophenyl phosphatase